MGNEDAAQRIELMEWEANNRTRKAEKFKFSPEEAGYGPEFCEACDEDMHEVRRAYGFKICVPCKELREAR